MSIMGWKQIWCHICQETVHVAVDEAASAFVFPVLGAATGGLFGSDRRGGGLGGAVLGLLVGAGLAALTAKAERVLCPSCGTHLE